MEYYKLLKLEREPFSNSPDPGLFFKSRQHRKCLQTLEISLRLKRGLNVVCGAVGTGKTTICRQLVRILGLDKQFETHLILDPTFESSSEFLKVVGSMLLGTGVDFSKKSDTQIREMIKVALFQKGVKENKTIILIVDEGQKIPTYCLELLRELLNYETNEFKLLQIIIFAQKEFEDVLENYENFTDRINLKFNLGPLSFKDTKQMIEYRVAQSGAPESNNKLFSFSGFLAVYMYTGGYPRKIINLCHKIAIEMIIKNITMADWILVRSVVIGNMHKKAIKRFSYPLILLLIIAFTAGYFIISDTSYTDVIKQLKTQFTSFVSKVSIEKNISIQNNKNDYVVPLPKKSTEKVSVRNREAKNVIKNTSSNIETDKPDSIENNVKSDKVVKTIIQNTSLKIEPKTITKDLSKKISKELPKKLPKEPVNNIKIVKSTEIISKPIENIKNSINSAKLNDLSVTIVKKDISNDAKLSLKKKQNNIVKLDKIVKIPTKNTLDNKNEVIQSVNTVKPLNKEIATDAAIAINKTNKILKAIDGMPNKMPLFLGSAVIKKGENLGDMVSALYGEYTKIYLQAVIDANKKKIGNANSVNANTIIDYPVISDTVELYNTGYIAAELGIKNNLENAFAFRRLCVLKNIHTRILPFWSIKDQNIKFAIVLNEFFFERKTATERIKLLPEEIRKHSKVRYWSANTLFLAQTPY